MYTVYIDNPFKEKTDNNIYYGRNSSRPVILTPVLSYTTLEYNICIYDKRECGFLPSFTPLCSTNYSNCARLWEAPPTKPHPFKKKGERAAQKCRRVANFMQMSFLHKLNFLYCHQSPPPMQCIHIHSAFTF